jgi:hypothetical protein
MTLHDRLPAGFSAVRDAMLLKAAALSTMLEGQDRAALSLWQRAEALEQDNRRPEQVLEKMASTVVSSAYS